MANRWPVEKQDEAIALYRQGVKYAKISEITGVPMATLVSWLHKRGVKPNRRSIVNEEGNVSVDALLTRLADAERQLGEALAENRILRAKIAELDVPQVTR